MQTKLDELLAIWEAAADPKPSAASVCAEHPELLEEFERRAADLDRANRALGAASSRTTADAAAIDVEVVRGRPDPSGHPAEIGRYRIVSVIGQGGMGVVYRAEQRHPVKRMVAVKLIKLGMDTREVIARFESERQALAMMDHPNVARVLDAGATDTGRPYFVMEYVSGEPITDYCDRNRLTTRERLDLFIQVCNAVQHAHQKGLIHRDLKPSNVLVQYLDGKPVPKVIDFGIAKATNATLTEKTLFTERGQMIGTPEYMSPEQAESSGADVDTRTDIYSLGVLLYELLTGTLPFDAKSLRSAGYAAIQKILREQDPPKPSTRLTALGEDIAEIAKRRRVDPRQLRRQVVGDLDWIILKALEKDRAKRYETANGLAMDVQRHLKDDPVAAGPPRLTYRLHKMVKRNRALFVSAGLVFVALAVGLVVAMTGMAKARRAAEHERRISEFVRELLLDPEAGAANAKELRLDDVLARGRDVFGSEASILPSVVAGWAATLGNTGRFDEARRAYRAAIDEYRRMGGPDAPSAAAAMLSLSRLTRANDDPAEADRLLQDVLEMYHRRFGDRSIQVADTLREITEEKIATPLESSRELVRRHIDRCLEAYARSVGLQDPRAIRARLRFADWLQESRFEEEGSQMFAKAFSDALRQPGARDESLYRAVQLYQLTKMRAWEFGVRGFGPKLAAPTFFWDEAERLAAEVYGSDSDEVISQLLGRAEWLRHQEDVSASIAVLKGALKIVDSTGKSERLIASIVLWKLTQSYDQLRAFDDVVPLLERMVSAGNTPWESPLSRTVAIAFSSDNSRRSMQFPSARDELTEPQRVIVLRFLKRRGESTLAADTAATRTIWWKQFHNNALADLLTWMRSDPTVDPRELFAVWLKAIHFDRPESGIPEDLRVDWRLATGDLREATEWMEAHGFDAEAEQLLQERIAAIRKLNPDALAPLAKTLLDRGYFLLKLNRLRDAKDVFSEAVALRKQTLPPEENWQIGEALGFLGEALTRLREYTEAEAVLLDAHKMVSSDNYAPRHSVYLAAKRLIKLYEASGNAPGVGEWQAKLPTNEPVKPPSSMPATRSN